MELNDLQKVILTKVVGRSGTGISIVASATAKSSATWLRKHKQTNNGKNYEKIQNK